jgi:hypothetical protein
LRKGYYAARVVAAMEYLAAEVFELGGNAAHKKTRIIL